MLTGVETMSAVRQTVKVEAGGRVHFTAPELVEGTQAEVIVLVPAAAVPLSPGERIAAWNRLRDQVSLSDEQARQWADDVKAERMAWHLPGDDVQP